jgi:hypothetical protein
VLDLPAPDIHNKAFPLLTSELGAALMLSFVEGEQRRTILPLSSLLL